MSFLEKTESEIIEACKRKDREAQNSLYKLFYSKMNAVGYRYVGSFEDAKDIVHDSFVHIFDKITSFEGNGSIEGWIRRIVVNRCIDFLNKKNKLIVKVSEEEERILNDKHAAYMEREEESAELDLNSIYKANITKEEILGAIDLLKDSFKIIFNLSVIDQYSHKAIAETLNISEEASRVRLKRARTALQIILIDIVNKKRNGNNDNTNI